MQRYIMGSFFEFPEECAVNHLLSLTYLSALHISWDEAFAIYFPMIGPRDQMEKLQGGTSHVTLGLTIAVIWVRTTEPCTKDR